MIVLLEIFAAFGLGLDVLMDAVANALSFDMSGQAPALAGTPSKANSFTIRSLVQLIAKASGFTWT